MLHTAETADSMSIEEKIKQTKPFNSEWERMIVNIMHTSAWLNEMARGHFELFDLTHQQYNVLRILRGSAPNAISTSDIRDRMIDRAPDTSRIVDRMIAKGLVNKQTCKDDKRRVDVVISKKGLKLLEEIDRDQKVLEEYAHTLTQKEARQLNDLLDKLKG